MQRETVWRNKNKEINKNYCWYENSVTTGKPGYSTHTYLQQCQFVFREEFAAQLHSRAIMSGLGVSVSSSPLLNVWHITDVHVDPYYVVGSSASTCYCETASSCPRMKGCDLVSNTSDPTRAEEWGNSEGNCASPQLLYTSAVDFMAKHTSTSLTGVNDDETPLVYFTGDFAEAGATAPCEGSAESIAQRQVLDIINWDIDTLRSSFQSHGVGGPTPNSTVPVFPSLGNHDSVPGDIYVGSEDMQWLYANLTSLVSDVLDDDGSETMELGGWCVCDRRRAKSISKNFLLFLLF